MVSVHEKLKLPVWGMRMSVPVLGSSALLSVKSEIQAKSHQSSQNFFNTQSAGGLTGNILNGQRNKNHLNMSLNHFMKNVFVLSLPPPCFHPLASFKTLDRYYTPLYEKVKNMPMETNCFKGLLSAVQPRLVYVTSFMNVPNRHDKRVILQKKFYWSF